MLPLDLLVDLAQVVHQLFFLALFPENIGHLLLEGADDVGMDLREKAVGIRDLLGTLPSGSSRPLVPQVQFGQREAERSKVKLEVYTTITEAQWPKILSSV